MPVPVAQRPECQVSGEDGNIFMITARASKVLKKNGLGEYVEEMQQRVTNSCTYYEALDVVSDYVEVM